jgi:hypothetical protein
MSNNDKSPSHVTSTPMPNRKKAGKLRMSPAQLEYVEKLLTILVAFTTFGASITFGLIVSQNKEPTDGPSKIPVIDKLIAVSWVLFVVGMLLSSLATTVLYAFQHVSSRKQDETAGRYNTIRNFIDYCEWKGAYAILTAYLVLLLFPLASALLCLAVVVTMYVWAVGIIALVFFGGGFAGILLFSLWYLALDAGEWAKEIEASKQDEGTQKLGADISMALEGYVKATIEAKLESMKPGSGTV